MESTRSDFVFDTSSPYLHDTMEVTRTGFDVVDTPSPYLHDTMEVTRTGFDVVDTPSPELRAKTPNIPWPSRKMFLARAKPPIKWRDLPLGIFFVHDRIDFGENDFGLCSKLQLQLKDGETFWVWGFDRLLKRLNKYPKTMFILNDGPKKSSFSNKSYFDFLLY